MFSIDDVKETNISRRSADLKRVAALRIACSDVESGEYEFVNCDVSWVKVNVRNNQRKQEEKK